MSLIEKFEEKQAPNTRCYRSALAWVLGGVIIGGWLIFGSVGRAGHEVGQTQRLVEVKASIPSTPSLRQTKSIEDVVLGDRVAGRNPIREQVETVEPDPATWRAIGLRMDKGGGRSLRVDLLRPMAWIKATGAEPGRLIRLDLPEMGAIGDAVVTHLGPCPEIKPGDGAVVTGRFIHQADEDSHVVELRLGGQAEANGVTANHPYWSTDRREFIKAGDLREGEGVDTESGVRRVASLRPAKYNGVLHNIETTEHVYRVGSLGTLVHNSCGVHVQEAGDAARRFLGDGYVVKRNDPKGFVAMSQDGKRIFRMDIQGHGDSPHAHIEMFDEARRRFVDAGEVHRYYFNGE